MIEKTLFHPVAATTAVVDRPVAAQLLGEDLVLWRDAQGSVQAFADHCPHRGAALSMGRVTAEGTLECAYHGWQFEAQGRCVAIPAVPSFVPPAEHRACRYQAREAHGLVWVALTAPSQEAALAVPAFAAEADARLRKVMCGPYEVKTSAPRIVENFLDMSHFGFVHEGWLGSRSAVEVPPYKVRATADGFLATECFAFQPQSSVHAQGGAMVEYTYEVNAPYTCVLTKVPDPASLQAPLQGEGLRESIALFVCPIEPERSRVWIRMAMNDFDSPDERLQQFQDTIFGQDQPVLESQRPKRLPITPQAPVNELHSAADRGSSAYRRYLRERGITFGVC